MKEYKMTIVDINTTITCKEGESILEAMGRQGLRSIVYGCYGGGCGQCVVEIIKGTFIGLKKMSRAHISEEDERRGRVLACCVQPTSDIDVQVIVKKK